MLKYFRPCCSVGSVKGAFNNHCEQYVLPAYMDKTKASNCSSTVPTVIKAASDHITNEIETVQQLAKVASQHPYYRFNYAWSRQMESVV